jgi:predicted phage-related endonuclease
MNEYFSDCIIETMPQRSDEWFAARKGILTASNFGPWLLATGKVAEGAKEKAICKLIAERANCDLGPNFENWAMKRGTELEPQAVAAFEGATGIKIQEVGFCKSLHGAFGCSPDGLVIGESAGLEGKVPVPDTHIRYRRAGKLPEEYMYQVHGSMAVTGAKSWWFQSFCPGLAPLRIVIERDEFTEKLKAALVAFSREFEQAWLDEVKANPRKLYTEVKMHDLDNGEVRTVNHRDECKDDVEKSAYDECVSRHEVITMGMTIAEPISLPNTATMASEAKEEQS